jgi:hypothetical protein
MTRATPTNKTVIDPFFTIPRGAEDEFVHPEGVTIEDEFDRSDPTATDFEDEDAIVEIIETDTDDTTFLELETPDEFSVFSQVLRRSPGGQQVVDVVIATEDIVGARNYEIRVTRI